MNELLLYLIAQNGKLKSTHTPKYKKTDGKLSLPWTPATSGDSSLMMSKTYSSNSTILTGSFPVFFLAFLLDIVSDCSFTNFSLASLSVRLTPVNTDLLLFRLLKQKILNNMHTSLHQNNL